MNLNFPFYMYPGAPCSGYYDSDIYFENLLKLQQLMDRLAQTISKSSILHITIGAPMDEFHVDKPERMQWQWQQLYPYHLDKCYDDGMEINHIIIAPNRAFGKKYIKPHFISQTNDKMQWHDNGSQYVDHNGRYRVWIFCTPLPNIDSRNSAIIARFYKIQMDKMIDIEKFIQTDEDKTFVNNFYKSMANLFDTVTDNAGFVTCFSFAVFNAQSDRAFIRDYVMFSEIKHLFDSSNRRLLAEWFYTEKCYVLSHYGNPDNISYVKPSAEFRDGNQIVFDGTTLKSQSM